MGKRFTDSDKWKKPFIRNLSVEHKLLWFYILDDCDVAGLWEVDIDVAEIKIGFKIDKKNALLAFENKIIEIDNGSKWFIPSFLEFQYGSQLSKANNIFRSIEKVLDKYNLYDYLNVEIVDSGTTTSALRGRLSQKTKDSIYLESEFICQYCSEQKPKAELVVDHFIPLNKGGDNSDENLVCSCVRCNSHKTDSAPDFFLAKNHSFLRPTEKVKNLLKAYNNNLKGGFSTLLGTKDKDKDKDKEMDKDMDKDKDPEILKKIEPLEIEIPDPFIPIWQRWVKYKKDQWKFKYASKDSEETAKKSLLQLCEGDPDKATKILDYAIGNGYKGFFELKSNPGGQELSKEDKNKQTTLNAINILQNKYKEKATA